MYCRLRPFVILNEIRSLCSSYTSPAELMVRRFVGLAYGTLAIVSIASMMVISWAVREAELSSTKRRLYCHINILSTYITNAVPIW